MLVASADTAAALSLPGVQSLAKAAGSAPRRLAPGILREVFATALARFRDAVGNPWVFTATADLELYRDAYSAFRVEPEDRFCSAAAAPDCVEQVRTVVQIANELKIPIYPIWGFNAIEAFSGASTDSFQSRIGRRAPEEGVGQR